MIDHHPKFIDPKELGVVEASGINHAQAQAPLPAVLRDGGGRVRWGIRGNTLEQNEQIGISNVQSLFLARFPEFDLRFPKQEDGTISKELQEAAKAFIVTTLADREKIVDVVGATVQNKRSTPYFEGSVLVAIEKSFSPWGIHFDFRRVDPQTNRYGDEGGRSWVTLEFLQTEYECDFKTLRKSLSETASLEGYGLNSHKTLLYNESEARAQLEKYARRNLLPKYDQENPQTIRIESSGYVSLTYLLQRYDEYHPNRKSLKTLLEELPNINGRARNGQEERFYLEKEAVAAIDAYFAPPQIDEAGRFIDDQGRLFMSISTAAKFFDSTVTTLRAHIDEGLVTTLEGRSFRRRHVILYEITTLTDILRAAGFFDKTRIKPDGYWTEQVIEDAARLFYKKKGSLTQSSLVLARRYDLLNAIQRYPGGLIELKKKISPDQSDRFTRHVKTGSPSAWFEQFFEPEE